MLSSEFIFWALCIFVGVYKIFLTAFETIFCRVSYLLSQVRLTHVGFHERHRNLLVSVTYSGRFNPEE